LRFLGPHGFDGPQGFEARFFAGPHGLEASFFGAQGVFCSALVGFLGASADAIGAADSPAKASASAATVDFLDMVFPFKSSIKTAKKRGHQTSSPSRLPRYRLQLQQGS